MRKFIFFITISFFLINGYSQDASHVSKSLSVTGYANKTSLLTDNYKVFFFIQEEEQKVGYHTIGKTSLDSIKLQLFKSLTVYGVKEKDLKIIITSSQSISQYPSFLLNILYEYGSTSKENAEKLVNELRLPGLKGIVARRISKVVIMQLQNQLYDEALGNAGITAAELAKKVNGVLGPVITIQAVSQSLFYLTSRETFDGAGAIYNMQKFEIDYRDQCTMSSINVTYELKQQ